MIKCGVFIKITQFSYKWKQTIVSVELISSDIRILRNINICFSNLNVAGLYNGECRPFIVGGLQVGVIRPDILKELFKYPEVFVIKDKEKSKVVELNPAFRDYNERTENVDRVLRQLRKDEVFFALKGWRDEVRNLNRNI